MVPLAVLRVEAQETCQKIGNVEVAMQPTIELIEQRIQNFLQNSANVPTAEPTPMSTSVAVF